MEGFTKPNSNWKNSYQGLEASLNRDVLLPNISSSLDFGSQSDPLLQGPSGPSMLNQLTTTQFTGQQYDQQANMQSELDEKTAKKRQRDREYRERCKKRKQEMKENLKALGRENVHLKKENESLKRENATMNQTTESKAEEIEQIKSNLNHKKFQHEKQKILVEILSPLLDCLDDVYHLLISLQINPDLDLENQKRKGENLRLRKNVEMNTGYSLVQLIKENSELQRQNSVLKVQNDALCEKIANDNRSKMKN